MQKANVVFDTQVFLRALIKRQSVSYRLLTEWNSQYTLHVTDGIVEEVLDVLTRSAIRQKFPQITNERVEFVRQMLSNAVWVEVKPEDIEPICRDPKDDIFLACAKAAQADYLVSEDNDLLVLEKQHDTQIVNVVTFLTVLESRRDQSDLLG